MSFRRRRFDTDSLGIKHVVVTSSFAAVGDFSKPATEQADRVYTEKDWNPAGDDYCESLKADE